MDPLDQLPTLAHPLVPLTLQDGQSIVLRVTGHTKGKMLVHPKGQPAPEEVLVIRLFGERLDKHSAAPYHDATAAQLVATIEPLLESPQLATATLKLRAQGYGIRKTFAVDVSPG